MTTEKRQATELQRLDAALTYAGRGWQVFPLFGIADDICTCGTSGCPSPGKHPRTRRGLHDATTDTAAIERWWTRWPDANIGIATGRASGLVVIDLDLPEAEGSLQLLEEQGFRLSPTPAVITGAGRHLYFACERHLTNTTRRLHGCDEKLPGLDLRADGGYVVAPPSVHISGVTYRWLDLGTNLAPLPHWIRAPKPRTNSSSMGSAQDLTGDGTPYGLAALRDEIDILQRTPEGARNDQLNRSAFALGQLIAGGELAETFARVALERAAHKVGLENSEAEATIDSGLSAGKAEPRRASFR